MPKKRVSSLLGLVSDMKPKIIVTMAATKITVDNELTIRQN